MSVTKINVIHKIKNILKYPNSIKQSGRILFEFNGMIQAIIAAEIIKMEIFLSTSCLYSTPLQVDINTKLKGINNFPKNTILEQIETYWLKESHKLRQGINNLNDSVKHPIKNKEKYIISVDCVFSNS